MSINQHLTQLFQEKFHHQAQWLIQAPGRVNLIGEHTDYNNGFVLPCAINFATRAAVAKNNRSIFRVYADNYHDYDEFDVQQISQHPNKQWANYIRGVIWSLEQKGFALSEGLDMVVYGDVPQGAGLSSSAALEVCIAKAVQTAFNLPIPHQELALIAQYAENHFVGCNCGIMDQLVSACGQQNHALLIDCENLNTHAISIPQNLSIMIIHSHVQRGLVDSEYNTRRQQCEQAAQFFGVTSLRDLTQTQWQQHHQQLDHTTAKRALYIIEENARTLAAAQALQNQDMPRLSQLMYESHEGMKTQFEITHPAIDLLVDLVREIIGEQGGVRMTGGGFGGCVVALVPHQLVDTVQNHIAQHYQAQTGLKEEIFICQASDGAHIIAP